MILAGCDPRSSASPMHLLHWEGSTKQKHSNTDALQQFTKLCGDKLSSKYNSQVLVNTELTCEKYAKLLVLTALMPKTT